MNEYLEREKEFEDMVLTPEEIRRFNKKYKKIQEDDYTVKKCGIFKYRKKPRKYKCK